MFWALCLVRKKLWPVWQSVVTHACIPATCHFVGVTVGCMHKSPRNHSTHGQHKFKCRHLQRWTSHLILCVILFFCRLPPCSLCNCQRIGENQFIQELMRCIDLQYFSLGWSEFFKDINIILCNNNNYNIAQKQQQQSACNNKEQQQSQQEHIIMKIFQQFFLCNLGKIFPFFQSIGVKYTIILFNL